MTEPEPTTAETVLAAFPELRDTDYGRHLDSLDREAERGLAQFRADMARTQCRHEESLYGRCTACGMTWDEQEKAGK